MRQSRAYLDAAEKRASGPRAWRQGIRSDPVQTTIRRAVSFSGIGLHTGAPVRMTIRPASPNHGIWFRRTDVVDGDRMVPARFDAVTPSRLCTVVENAAGVGVSTIEHVMAALSGTGIHNALIDIDGPEVPILDGSAAPFVSGILGRGLRELDEPVRCLEILETVEVREGDAVARLEPAATLEMTFEIDFDDQAIGRQEKLPDSRSLLFFFFTDREPLILKPAVCR